MGVDPEKEDATNNRSGKMSKKKKNIDNLQIKQSLKMEKLTKTITLEQSQAAVLSLLLQCLTNGYCSFFSL